MKSIGHSKRGFTLVEMLITVAVIAVLAVLLVPAIRAVRANSMKVTCLSHLRSIYLSTLAFTADYNDNLPPPTGPATDVDPRFIYNAFWWVYLQPYTVGPLNRRLDSAGRLTQEEATIYNCPVRLTLPIIPYPNGTATVSYVMSTPSQHRLLGMENKSQTLFLTEGSSNTLFKSVAKSSDIRVTDAMRRLKRFHHGALHILFFDGHLELFSGTDEELAEMLPK